MSYFPRGCPNIVGAEGLTSVFGMAERRLGGQLGVTC